MSNTTNNWQSAKKTIYLSEPKPRFELDVKKLLAKYPNKKEFTFIIKSK